MSHSDLYRLREYNLQDKELQKILAPLEHKAFAREATADNPLMAVPIGLATPLYAGAKAMGFMTDETTTKPSMEQVKQGLIGVGQGLRDSWQGAKPR